jgi:2-polyprenyl-6-methoxyphenol hydroxylase-like FAD-dependent oxidoreductase
MAAPRAIVVGAGIAGLSAGIALHKAGWQVQIFEQAHALEPMGAALSIWPNAVAALDWLGCREALHDQAASLNQLAIVASNGRAIMRNELGRIMPNQTGYLPSRTALQSALLDRAQGIPIHMNCPLFGYEERPDGVIVRFQNDLEAEADMLVAADGIRSKIARNLTGVEPKHAGYGGVLALSGSVIGNDIDGCGTEYWGRGERFGLFDLGGNRRYWFYMRNEAGASEASKVSIRQVRKQMQEWPEIIQSAVDATAESALIPFSIHAKPAPKMLARGRVVLVGDAGHAMEPNLGQGACQALEDAVALGAAARQGDATKAASLYQQMRLKRVRQLVALSAQGSIIAHRLPGPIAGLTMQMMGPIFRKLAPRQMRQLFAMPDYEKLAA